MNAPRNRSESPAAPQGEWLSALYDGDPSALEGGCRAWRDDAQARATWHTYHLIGDVMRSDDLASTPARDAAFLAALRTRLDAEPVVLAPAATPRRRQVWLLSSAAAAGFVAVAGVLVVVRMSSTDAPRAPMVAATNTPSVTLASTRADAPTAPAYGPMIRDPQLDRYLQAHRAALIGGAVAVPGGVPRNLEAIGPVTPVAAPVAR